MAEPPDRCVWACQFQYHPDRLAAQKLALVYRLLVPDRDPAPQSVAGLSATSMTHEEDSSDLCAGIFRTAKG